MGLSVLLGVVVVMGMLLVRWKTGVGEGPLSLVVTAGFVRDEEVRGLLRAVEVDLHEQGGGFIGTREMERVFGWTRFLLGWAVDEKGDRTNGIMMKPAVDDESELPFPAEQRQSRREPWLPGWMTRQPTTDVVTLCGTTLLCGLLVFVLYYETTHTESGFEDFMNDQNFGARILFAGLGVAISFFGGVYYSSKSPLPPLPWPSLHSSLPTTDLVCENQTFPESSHIVPSLGTASPLKQASWYSPPQRSLPASLALSAGGNTLSWRSGLPPSFPNSYPSSSP